MITAPNTVPTSADGRQHFPPCYTPLMPDCILTTEGNSLVLGFEVEFLTHCLTNAFFFFPMDSIRIQPPPFFTIPSPSGHSRMLCITHRPMASPIATPFFSSLSPPSFQGTNH